MIYTMKVPSPVGSITAASNGEAICGLWIDGQKYYAAAMGNKTEEKDLPVFTCLRSWLDCYFEGREPDFSVPLLPMEGRGSEFRQKVWKILLEIPYGQVITYKEIADRMEKITGKRQSAQAVGGAVGHNPISILIPCHRVVGTGGSLTGYAGGIDKKVFLLKLERVSMDHLFIPVKGTAL